MPSLPLTFVDGFHDANALEKLQYHHLGETGLRVSNLSLGASALGGVFCPVDEEECIQVVIQALKNGINYIDVSPFYGNEKSEAVLGKAFAAIPRQAYYIGTKVGRYAGNRFDFSSKTVLQSVDDSLARLKCGYIDIIQVHDLEFAKSPEIILNETLPALLKIKESGKARFIGITGYPIDSLITILDRSSVKIDTVLSYSHCCLHDTTLLNHMDYFIEKKVGVIDAAGLGMGLFTTDGPPKWHVAPMEIKIASQKASEYCKNLKVDISKLALHYNLTRQGPSTHVISCAKLKILEDNITTWKTGLTSQEETALEEILNRFFKPLTVTGWEGIEIENFRLGQSKKES